MALLAAGAGAVLFAVPAAAAGPRTTQLLVYATREALVVTIGADGYRLLGGVSQYEGIWRMASVRGPEGFIVNLAQRMD